MRFRSLLWFLASLLCFAAAVVFWRMGNRWAAEGNAGAAGRAAAAPQAAAVPSGKGDTQARKEGVFRLVSEAGNLNRPEPKTRVTKASTEELARTAYRLSNTPEPVNTLARRPSAILLENALFDTSVPRELAVPPHLRAQGDPGA